MSSFRFVARTVCRPHASPSIFVANAQRRGLRLTPMRSSGKEDALHQDKRAEEIDAHSSDQLNKHKEGEGHWKDELASNSESIVKAERGEVDATAETIDQLQKETEALHKKQREEGKAPKSGKPYDV